MTEPDFHDPDRPTRYVTPGEFGVGTNFVAGCPICQGETTVPVEYRFRSWRHPFRGVWRTVEERCRFCGGFGTVLYDRIDNGLNGYSFHPQPR